MEHDIGRTFLTQLLATPAGQQHLLSISVAAEEGDEGDLFGMLAEYVQDPELRRTVERHRDDEARHALLFRACLDRLGLEVVPIPDELRVVQQVGHQTGRTDVEITSDGDVVTMYALLHAIERHGVEQFPLIAEAFRDVDPETADVYLRVARDERGHVRHCERIGRLHAPDDATWAAALAQAAAQEERAFLEVGSANLTHCAERGWVRLDEVLGAAPTTAPSLRPA